LNGVQEVPGSNPGSPIFRNLRKLLRSEEIREDCETWEVWQFAGNSLQLHDYDALHALIPNISQLLFSNATKNTFRKGNATNP
jgi:hypothetical protein